MSMLLFILYIFVSWTTSKLCVFVVETLLNEVIDFFRMLFIHSARSVFFLEMK